MTSREVCERRIVSALNSKSFVRVMISALRDAGCPIVPHRHFACDECQGNVYGGFDVKVNQVRWSQLLVSQKISVENALTCALRKGQVYR